MAFKIASKDLVTVQVNKLERVEKEPQVRREKGKFTVITGKSAGSIDVVQLIKTNRDERIQTILGVKNKK